MKSGKNILRYAAAVAAAAAIAALVAFYEAGIYGADAKSLLRFLSDGFFVAAVFYIGFGLLLWISDAGSFYAFGYLGYMVVRIFSPLKHRFEERKDYFSYCAEKKAKRKESGKAAPKYVLLAVGVFCAALSAAFVVGFYGG